MKPTDLFMMVKMDNEALPEFPFDFLYHPTDRRYNCFIPSRRCTPVFNFSEDYVTVPHFQIDNEGDESQTIIDETAEEIQNYALSLLDFASKFSKIETFKDGQIARTSIIRSFKQDNYRNISDIRFFEKDNCIYGVANTDLLVITEHKPLTLIHAQNCKPTVVTNLGFAVLDCFGVRKAFVS